MNAKLHRLFQGVYWHWQNLNSDDMGRIKGSGFWTGRAWLVLRILSFHIEWHFGRRATPCSAGVVFGCLYNSGYPGISFHVGFPRLLNLYFSVSLQRFLRWIGEGERETGWWWMDGTLWLEFMWDSWSDATGGKRRGYQKALHIKDWITGKRTYSETTRSEHNVVIEMPEGNYPARVKLVTRYWHYQRWFTKAWNSAEIDLYKPIPVPAKEGIVELVGDYDDAIYSMSCPAETVEDAVRALQSSVDRDRRRGNWD